MNFCFGDIVVIEGSLIGVVVKSWISKKNGVTHEVYVRAIDGIREYPESEMQRYMVRHKYLDDEEVMYQNNAINGV